MCDSDELLGEHHSVARDAAGAAAIRDEHIESVAQLIRLKTGFDCEPVLRADGLIAFRRLEFRAFGIRPAWCRPGKKIDNQDPSRLATKFETSPREDGLLDCKASIYLLSLNH